MSYNAQYLRAKVAAAWQIIQATAAAESISVAFRVATIGLVTELGRFVEVLFKQENVGLTDDQKRNVYKVSSDTYAALDKYISTLSKPKTDGSTFGDKEYATVTKALKELTGVLDTCKATISKPFYDQVVGLEEHVYVFAKKAPENFVAPVDRIDTKAVGKLRLDAWAVSDDETIAFYKERSDAAGFADARYGFIAKVLTDIVNTTDDIDGATSIDDDQEVQFFKVVSELTATHDDFYRFMEFVRGFSDAAGFSDGAYHALAKPFSELVTGVEDHTYVFSQKTPDNAAELADAYALTTDKPIIDACAVADIETVAFDKERSDALSFGDTNLLLTSKSLSENEAVSDAVTNLVSKSLAEAFGVADFLDQVTIVVKRDFFDQMPVADAKSIYATKPLADNPFSVIDSAAVSGGKVLAELAFWSEILYRNTNKSLVDTSNVSELKAISAVKPTNDGFSLTDSGSLRSQSYCDFDYIAEDYVGVSRTF